MTAQSGGTVAVFGATGKQGGAVVDSLLSRGARVRALVRSPESDKARALAGRGVEVARVDIHDAASLSAALQEVSAFFFMTTPEGPTLAEIEGETRQGLALVDAAVATAVPNVVFSSVGGADRNSGVPHFESKRRVEERLEKSGLPVTLVRPVAFMDNYTFMGPSLENGEIVLRWPMPDRIPLQLVAVRDIGEISALFLLAAAEAPGGAIEVAGDERTGSQIAAAFGEHTGLPTRYEALPLDVLGGNEDAQAMFRWFAETPAYQADIRSVRAIEPSVWDLPMWLRSGAWTLPVPAQSERWRGASCGHEASSGDQGCRQAIRPAVDQGVGAARTPGGASRLRALGAGRANLGRAPTAGLMSLTPGYGETPVLDARSP